MLWYLKPKLGLTFTLGQYLWINLFAVKYFYLQVSSPVSTPVHLENPESQTRWYFKYFLGKCKYFNFKCE